MPFSVFIHLQNHAQKWKSESELFNGDTSKDNHSPGSVIRGASPYPFQEK